MRYATVVIPSSPTPFTYALACEAVAGDLITVPLRKSEAIALVIGITSEQPPYEVRETGSVVRRGVLRPWQVELASWMATNYFAHIGKTFRLFVPERVWQDKPLKRAVKEQAPTALPAREHTLNSEQQTAVERILHRKKSAATFLLHGITGSGKTEVYLRIISDALSMGRQAILLVPEIALTPQLVGYFASEFPSEHIAVIHSNLAEGVRVATWERIHAGTVKLVIGSRSALFVPVQDPGVIILDEEHEWTYKNDQSPRYHARTTAQKMAELTGSTLVFGSATPSFESFAAAKAGKIELLTLTSRATGAPLPTVSIVDLKQEFKKENFSLFSELLVEKMRERITRNEQIILLLNKRGYASSIACRDCGAVVECPHCALALTTHRYPAQKLICHLCGHIATAPRACAACGSLRIRELGTGTEKLEQELAGLFPGTRVLRADRDTTSGRDGADQIFSEFRAGQAAILVGTQIIAKGLDIPNVTLVGVLLADTGLHIPDFRAGEKTFALLAQVAGRAGRAGRAGEVIIQTFSDQHPAIRAAAEHDYLSFFNTEIRERRQLHYPPFTRVVKFDFVARTEKQARLAAEAFVARLKTVWQPTSGEHLSIAPALIAKSHDKYHFHVIFRSRDIAALLSKITIPDDVRVDVDPVSLT